MNQGSDRVLSTPLKSRIPDLRVKINHLLSYKGSSGGSFQLVAPEKLIAF